MSLDIPLGNFLERHRPGHLKRHNRFLGLPGIEGVHTLRDELARVCGLLSRFGKGKHGQAAQPHLTSSAGDLVSEKPGPRPGGGDLQIEPATVRVRAGGFRDFTFMAVKPAAAFAIALPLNGLTGEWRVDRKPSVPAIGTRHLTHHHIVDWGGQG